MAAKNGQKKGGMKRPNLVYTTNFARKMIEKAVKIKAGVFSLRVVL
jgi:hypothetical protein